MMDRGLQFIPFQMVCLCPHFFYIENKIKKLWFNPHEISHCQFYRNLDRVCVFTVLQKYNILALNH